MIASCWAKGYADVLLVPPSMGIGKDLYFQSSCIEPPCVEAQRGSAKGAALLPAIRASSNKEHTRS